MTCVYCAKNTSPLTEEHVVPRALGGALQPTNPFKLNRVCRRCNTLCGRYVDRPFVKNWIVANYLQSAAYQLLDVTAPGSEVPLIYMGPIPEATFGDRMCELWLGPAGDVVYHFHRPWPQEPDTPISIGPPPPPYNDDSVDHGFVIAFVRPGNPEWYQCIFNSISSAFSRADIYLGNGNPPGEPFKKMSGSLYLLWRLLKKIRGREHKAQFAMSVDFADRFMGKLALGLGALHLDPSFEASPDADLLRTLLWTKASKARSTLPIHGVGLLSGKVPPQQKQLFGEDHCHTILLHNSQPEIALYVIISNAIDAVIKVSANGRVHWPATLKSTGIVYLVSPGLKSFVGPIDMPTYVAWKTVGASHAALDAFKLRLSAVRAKPAFSPGGIPDPKAKREMRILATRFEAEFFARFVAAVPGAIFRKDPLKARFKSFE